MAALFISFQLIVLVKPAGTAGTNDRVVFCRVELHVVSGKEEKQYR